MLKNEKIIITIFFDNNMMMYIKNYIYKIFPLTMTDVSYNIQLCILFSVRGKHNNFYKICVVIHSYLSHNRFSNGMAYGQWCKDRINGCSINML
jgi:hypothetical protein